MLNYFQNVLIYVLQLIFDLYLYFLMIYLLLRWQHFSFINPFMRFLAKLAQPITVPFRKILPKKSEVDLLSLIIGMLLIEIAVNLLMFYLRYQQMPHIAGLVVISSVELLRLLINTLFYAILISVVASFLAPLSNHPVLDAARTISEPLFRPFQKRIPAIAGIDISPIFALALLQIIEIFMLMPVKQFALLYLI